MVTFERVENGNLLLLKALSGSRAYGLDLPTSDTDYKGVFLLPKSDFFGQQYVEQVSNETNDIVYYELGRFFDLLLKNNPNLIELLATPPESQIYRHPAMAQVKAELFLSKRCRETFAGYALAQVRKARGLNKKILNPMGRERKTPLDFCWIPEGQGSTPLRSWLERKGIAQENCGLINLPHMHGMYAVFQGEPGQFRGILHKPNANEVALSSIPKDSRPEAYLFFNKDGYKRYCKDYKEYWNWVEKRNDARYENTLSHGKNYDSKNMMHTFRLLDMAEEIGRYGEVRVFRENRDYYLKIRTGEFNYEDLVSEAEAKIAHIDEVYAKSDLPDQPDETAARDLLISLREELYG